MNKDLKWHFVTLGQVLNGQEGHSGQLKFQKLHLSVSSAFFLVFYKIKISHLLEWDKFSPGRQVFLLPPATRGLAKFSRLSSCPFPVWRPCPQQSRNGPQPQKLKGHTRLYRSVPQLCAQSPEPQWLLCFLDSLSQGKIPFGLSQELLALWCSTLASSLA